MIATRTLWAALALGSVLGAGCYSEQLPPPNYLYACEADADCTADEICRDGLCVRPCNQTETFIALLVGAEPPCPFESGYAGCYNGACAKTCELGASYCSKGQTCIDVDIEGGGGFFGGSSAEVGVCATACSDSNSAELCDPAETCDEGVCTPIDCESGAPCPEGYVCSFGACAPDCTAGQACPSGQSCNVLFGICSPDCDPACDEGTTCFFGACATDCSAEQECPDDQSCLLGVCIVDGIELPLPGGDDGGGSSGGGGTTGGGTTGGESTGSESTDGGSSGDMTGTDGSTGMGVAPGAEEDEHAGRAEKEGWLR